MPRTMHRAAGLAGFATLLACTPAGVRGDPYVACTGAFDCGPADDEGDAATTGLADDDDAESDGPTDDPVPGLPCAVRDVLAAQCGTCHGATPAYGAPMALVDFADLQVPAVTDPTTAVFEMVGERLVDAMRPMPPDGSIDPTERDVLLQWIAAGAPEDPTADCEGDAPPPDDGDPIGPDALPCTDPVELVAHASGEAAPFAVPSVGAEDLYQCFAFASPFAAGAQASAWAPIIDDERVVHHWILYRTSEPQQDGDVFPCDASLQLSADFVAGWAPGGGNVELPADVGLELGVPDEWFVLQVHYHNAAQLTDAADGSGVAFCVAEPARPQTAGVLTLGTVDIDIPAGATAHAEVGECGWLSTVFWPELHIIGASPHMHEHGRAFRTIVEHGDGGTETIVDVPVFAFDGQGMYLQEPEILVQPGDRLVTTCTYDNPGTSPVVFGEGTGDEMCFDFVLAYPIDALDSRNCGILF